MKKIKRINLLLKEIKTIKNQSLTIGLVPTMGALHKGHISLVREAKKISDKVIVSIFVNPIQFGENEDLSIYPRPIEEDIRKLEKAGADILFYPDADEMYRDRTTKVCAEKYASILCGETRKNHFDGVLTVVAKLFNITSPNFAFFGEKDFQQLFLIRKMVKDLDFNVKIIPCPIVREPDMLAMSSRNVYLSKKERSEAPVIYNTLIYARELFAKQVKPAEIEKIAKEIIESNSSGRVEYIKIYESKTLNEPALESRDCRIFAAVKFGETRLIDNIGAKK